MRVTTLLRRLLGVTQMHVRDAHVATDGPLSVWVRPSWRRSRCGRCGRRRPRYDRRPLRQWRHLPWGRTPVWLQYAPWRVSCRRCGVRVERVPWAAGSSVFTAPFEELAAYLAQVTDRTTVSRALGISWQAVGSIVERVVSRRLDPERLAGLRRIGVDEFSYRKRHHYLTVVVDHDKRRVVWAGKGRSAETLKKFFDLLGPSGCEQIVLVTAGPGRELAESVAGKGAARRGGLRPVPCGTACLGRGRRGPAGGATASGRQGGQDAQGVALLPAETPRRGSSPARSGAWRPYAARIVPSTAPTS